MSTKSPATMKTEDLKVLAKELGLEFTENIDRTELIRAVCANQKRSKDAQGNENGGDNPNPPKGETNAKTSSKVVYYWIKMASYIDDNRIEADKLLPVGFYKFGRILPRLENSPLSAVEKFEGEIAERALLKIAEAVGMTFDASDDVDFEDLLTKLLNQTTFK